MSESLLDAMLAASPIGERPTPRGEGRHSALAAIDGERDTLGSLDGFLGEPDAARAVVAWLDLSVADLPIDGDAILRRLDNDVATIDRLLSDQVNAILHHPRFQKLEASWRGLAHLVEAAAGEDRVRVRALNIRWRELIRDAEGAIEFDQSELFRKVYSEEFDTPGGEPYGIMVVDHAVRLAPSDEHPYDDMAAMWSIAHVAAAAFCPFLFSAHPSLLGLESFDELTRPLNLARLMEQPDHLKWRALREIDDARFLSLLAPPVLMREPYPEVGMAAGGYCFREEVEGPDASKHLWGSTGFALAGVVIRAFIRSAWFADIRGFRVGEEAAGLVVDLPTLSFSTDRPGLIPRFKGSVAIVEEQEKELADLGFGCLCPCPHTPYSVFYSVPSIQQPKKYDERIATVNARLSAMIPYVLCVSRFTHYVKVIGRNRLGAFTDPGELERYLHNWLHRYVLSDDNATQSAKAEYPLREATVEVRERPDKPGSMMCVTRLRPHFQLEDMLASVRLVTELAAPRSV